MKLFLYSGILSAFWISCKADFALSVTSYGDLQISMVQHGEKYASDRDCYELEDITPKYYGMTHVRGPNDKVGTYTMTVNVPVKIYLGVDSRNTYVNGNAFFNNGDRVTLGGCHARTPHYIYESKSVQGPGMINITWQERRMGSIFLADARLIGPWDVFKVTFPHAYPLSEYSMVREGEKFSTNRDCYAMADVPPKYYGMLHLRGINDKTSPIEFSINVPSVVYVAIDSRHPNPLDSDKFRPTGEKIVHAGCHTPIDFPIYEYVVRKPGMVTINLSHTRMCAVFLTSLKRLLFE